MKSIAILGVVALAGSIMLGQSPAPSSGNADTQQPQNAPDNRPVTGARNLGLGSDTEHLNSLESSLSVSVSGTTNPRFTTTSGTDWSALTSVSGRTALNRSTKIAITDLSYQGAGTFYSQNSDYNTQTHQFGVAETINLRRWTVMLADSMTYEPDGSLGLPWYGNAFGNDSSDLRLDYLLNGTILTPNASQLSNTAVAELQYGLSRNTSVTATGSYSLLRFPDTELLDTTQRTLSGGWNHSYGRNTVGLQYSNTMFHYQSLPISMQTHAAEFTYARRMTRRYSFEIGGGPDVLVTKAGGVEHNEVFGAGRFALRREDGRTLSSLSYTRGISGGSGVTVGAKTDQVLASVSHLFGREVTIAASTGYARNAAALTLTTFNTVTASAAVARRFGRNASMSLGYYYQRQMSDGVYDHLQNHTVMFTFAWAFRPLRFR